MISFKNYLKPFRSTKFDIQPGIIELIIRKFTLNSIKFAWRITKYTNPICLSAFNMENQRIIFGDIKFEEGFYYSNTIKEIEKVDEVDKVEDFSNTSTGGSDDSLDEKSEEELSTSSDSSDSDISYLSDTDLDSHSESESNSSLPEDKKKNWLNLKKKNSKGFIPYSMYIYTYI